MRNNGHRRIRTQRDYWWVCAVEKSCGRPIVQGPHNTDNDARQWGVENIWDNAWEVFPFPTINKIAARDRYKSIVLERTKLLPSVFQRAIYPKTTQLEGGKT